MELLFIDVYKRQQKSLNLQQQALQTDYDLNRLRKSFALDKEEYRMGKTLAQAVEVIIGLLYTSTLLTAWT